MIREYLLKRRYAKALMKDAVVVEFDGKLVCLSSKTADAYVEIGEYVAEHGVANANIDFRRVGIPHRRVTRIGWRGFHEALPQFVWGETKK